jgi:anthranilate synthase component I
MIRRELSADTETPVSLFMTVRTGETHAALFESVEGRERWARRSLIALGARKTVVARSLSEVTSVLELASDAPKSPLDYAFGSFAYEAAQAFIPLANPMASDGAPLAEFFLPEAVLLYDHRKHMVEAFFFDAAVEARVMANLAQTPRAPLLDATLRAPASTATRAVTPSEFATKVQRTKEYIAAGDAFQVVVSQKFQLQAGERDLFRAYRALRRDNPSPYLYYFVTPHLEAAGASPETLIRVENDVVHVRPLAGTRGRGRSDADDEAIERELLADPKERAEHLMLVDLGRNDVGRVRAWQCGGRPDDGRRALFARDAHRLGGERHAAQRPFGARCLRCGVSRRHAFGRPEETRHGDHRRARRCAAGALRRCGGLLRITKGV